MCDDGEHDREGTIRPIELSTSGRVDPHEIVPVSVRYLPMTAIEHSSAGNPPQLDASVGSSYRPLSPNGCGCSQVAREDVNCTSLTWAESGELVPVRGWTGFARRCWIAPLTPSAVRQSLQHAFLRRSIGNRSIALGTSRPSARQPIRSSCACEVG
jgi:hypothetical protein